MGSLPRTEAGAGRLTGCKTDLISRGRGWLRRMSPLACGPAQTGSSKSLQLLQKGHAAGQVTKENFSPVSGRRVWPTCSGDN